MDEFRQRYTPNWDKLTELVEKAKGPNRTMREFAAQCQISPATFTRIVQKRYVKALSDEMLLKIVNNADPDSGITLDQMKRANGFVSGDEEKAVDEEFEEIIRNDKEYSKVFEIFKKELMDRGYSCMALFKGFLFEEGPKSKLFFNEFDEKENFTEFTLCIKGYEPKYWKICECDLGISSRQSNTSSLTEDEIVIRILCDYGVLFLRDAWDPESMKDIMYSFVFKNENHFDVFTRAMANINVNNYMSVVLVDTETEKVIKEVMFNRFDGKKMASYFDAPYIKQGGYTRNDNKRY